MRPFLAPPTLISLRNILANVNFRVGLFGVIPGFLSEAPGMLRGRTSSSLLLFEDARTEDARPGTGAPGSA